VNLQAFDKLPTPWQNEYEWLAFLMFCESYFKSRQIDHPLVVELGVYENRQQPFYLKFLEAKYIGIDASNEYTEPDILGDTHAPETIDKLKAKLTGNAIDLLYIDASHEYDAIHMDYELYNPLVKQGLIALHDLYSYPNSVGKFWKELIEASRNDRVVTFLEIKNWASPTHAMGIGVIIRG
jgi:hypothetical protein